VYISCLSLAVYLTNVYETNDLTYILAMMRNPFVKHCCKLGYNWCHAATGKRQCKQQMVMNISMLFIVFIYGEVVW